MNFTCTALNGYSLREPWAEQRGMPSAYPVRDIYAISCPCPLLSSPHNFFTVHTVFISREINYSRFMKTVRFKYGIPTKGARAPRRDDGAIGTALEENGFSAWTGTVGK